jgi:hypothetical protein
MTRARLLHGEIDGHVDDPVAELRQLVQQMHDAQMIAPGSARPFRPLERRV